MSKPKKPSTDELYAKSQWSDNLLFSRKAMDESKKKTDKLDALAAEAEIASSEEQHDRLDQYVNEMNQEINRMSDAVGERMDDLGHKLNRSLGKIVRPLGKSVNYVADNASESFKNMGSGIGKAVLQEFTSVIRNLGNKMAAPGDKQTDKQGQYTPTQPLSARATGTGSLGTGSLGTGPLPPPLPISKLPEAPEDVPRFEYHFGILLQQKIFFSTIHNQPFLNERDIEAFRPDDPVQIFEWMERGAEEIRKCAPYGQKLPTPQKGPYTNMPMQDILLQVTPRDLSQFLRFVCNRPQPFQKKALKLSEAFATWAHKGAPAQ